MSSQAGDKGQGAAAAILTTTILQSSVVKAVLHAKIKNRSCNNVVFVGNSFVAVKEVKDQEHLEHVVTKCDFDATIRAAKTFTINTDDEKEPSFIKRENPDSSTARASLPPQLLVLTLDSNDIVFLYLTTADDGEHRFVHQTCPMPTFDRALFQPGNHLAVDTYSRAFATAASEREVVIYAAKSTAQIQHEIAVGDPDWVPVSAQRPIQIEGVIQHMEFLMPPSDDEDHVILLLIVVQRAKTKAMWIDWHYTSGVHHAQIHDALPLDQPRSVASLLIPLRNAAFLLTNGDSVRRFPNLLSGSTAYDNITIAAGESTYVGESPRHPMWTNWCRPERDVGANSTLYLYLAREDGNVSYIEDRQGSDMLVSCNAGNMDCRIGTAFASVGGLDDPDILVAAGEMSSGCVKSIGATSTLIRVHAQTRGETMNPKLLEIVPNWTSVTDLVASTLPGKSQRSRDGIFVTSGRQPFGSVTELRYGIEAKLSVYMPLADFDLRSVQNVWALPLVGNGDMIVMLSRPGSTDFLELRGEFEVEPIEPSSLDFRNETLMAAAMPDGQLVQVTTKSICSTSGTNASFEDCARIDMEGDNSVLAAVCSAHQYLAITAERNDGTAGGYAMVSYAIPTDQPSRGSRDVLSRLSSFELPSEALAISCVRHLSNTIVFATTSNGEVEAFSVDTDGTFKPLCKRHIPAAKGDTAMCDNIAILRSTRDASSATSIHLIVCGLRDGRLYTVQLEIADELSFGREQVLEFGRSSVKLVQPPDQNSVAYATSGLDTCLLSWHGGSEDALEIENIWISDKGRPELAQGAITACTHTPPADLLSSPQFADSVVFLSGDELLFTNLQHDATTVPRQIPVEGTPSRLMYLEQQRCLACSSLKYDVRIFSAPPYERRQIWPVIDFIPSKSSAPSYSYDMQPGERAYALLEWSFRRDDDKVYCFVLAGGSYVSPRSGQIKGRITFLQPTSKSWEVTGVTVGRPLRFDDPVYAIALLDPLTFVACSGCNVLVHRFNTEESKWQVVCRPFMLHSAGTAISIDGTAEGALISISTNTDSLVVLRVGTDTDSDAEDGFQYQLTEHCTAPKADASLHHLALPDRGHDELAIAPNTTLLTTKNGKFLGLQHPTAEPLTTTSSSSHLLFEALLPRSLTRIKQAQIRPPWKPARPAGVLADNIIACSADGTLTGALLLSDHLYRRLSWLQRLCEWSPELSPHSHQTPVYSASGETFARNERGMPIGFGDGGAESEVVMRTERKWYQDRHVDGDVLKRVLERGGAECLRRLVREAAERQDAVGEWMRAHLEEELEAVEEVVEIVRRVVDGWL